MKPATKSSRTRQPARKSRVHGSPAAAAKPEETAAAPIPPAFPIVGIGASAGGLAAFEAFFSAMPADKNPGMAFVLVQHLDPNHKSILTELIRRYTRMEVFEVQDGMTVKPNCAYIIPPNRDMAFLNGALQLLEPAAPRGQRLPIDFFFRSLAQDQHERAIAIVLTGTGSDGSLGVRAIKEEGGMVMAQNPQSTEYDGMPRAAIATGLVDYILPPAEMPARLMAFAAHAFGRVKRPTESVHSGDEGTLKKIFILLRSETNHDFSLYKQNTIIRRIERRMAVNQIERLDGYVGFLQQNGAEVTALFRDLLIGVTRFFRDPDVFTVLAKQVVPALLAGKPSGAAVRVWVPGCSTGEEAYSIAMLIQEEMIALKLNHPVQIFATDIDDAAIAIARAGSYPSSISADAPPERLARHFNRSADGTMYRINKNLRDMVVFSEQDIIKDPPFSRLDLISCRNLLIYMSGDLQKKLMPLFNYSLLPGGFLLLGTSETVGEFHTLFAPVDRKTKVYQRKSEARGNTRRLPPANILPPASGETPVYRPGTQPRAGVRHSPGEITERALLQHFASAGVLVNEHGDVLYLHGRTGRYLEPSPGDGGMNILKMAREGLQRDLTTALHRVVSQNKQVYNKGLKVKTNGDFTTVNLTVRPVAATSAGPAEPRQFLIILEDAPETTPRISERDTARGASRRGITTTAQLTALKGELQAKEEHLQSVIEELQTSNEEFKSTNEEMQSVNEELQSTNEELETSKEELQSVNEELSTVNNELQTKVTDLSRVNNDMNNLLSATGVGTIFVDQHLRIQRFTPAITKIINLILSDVGRPVGHIVSNLSGYDHLTEDVQEVLETLIPFETEVQTKGSEWFLLRIIPYRTVENVIEGTVITFTDITVNKQAQETLRGLKT